tara:strand:- start:1903 stop:5427 length:3525 start_codon:yes stop_codon:yes gene_type:complete
LRSLPESFESAFISPATNLIYMVEIEGDDGNTIRIASREGHSISVYDGVDGDGDELYIDELYHDADLKISTISESVDLNSKAVKLSEITITCSNFPIFMTDTEQRFSDLLKNANGKTINIKIKPDGSTDTLNLAEGVVTRVKHDSNAITISANDSTLDVIDMQLPKLENRLDKDVNTYDYYHDKYVPLLYGHLRAAPAMVHLSDLTEITSVDNGTVKLLPDTSYLDGSDMEGVKGFEKDIELETMNGTEVFSPSRNCLEMRRQDVVRMKVGENVCDVPCLPYIQSRSKIIDKHDYKQWDSVGNYVSLNTTDENGSKTEITNNAVWCAINQKPYPNDDNKRTIQMEFFENTKWKAFVNSHELSEISTGHETSAGKLTYKVGVEFFSFDTLSGYELDDRRDDAEKLKFENDVHFIGNFKGVHKNFYGAANAYHHDLTRFFPVFSSPNVESNEFVGGDTGADYSYYLGYPKELHKWRFITSQGNQESYNAIQGNHSNDLENMHNDLNRAKFHMAGASDFDYDDPELTYNSYITSFISGRFNFDADNCFVGRHYTWHKNIYPVMDATTLAIYYFADGLNSTSQYPNFSFDLETYWRDLEMRKVWLNTNMFERDYFLNARGKRSPNGDGSGLIRGTMFIKYEGTDQPNFDNPQNDSSAEATKRDNIHLTELYKYLTDPELETIRHEGKEYQIMLMAQQSDGNITYYYDFDIENVIFCEDNLPYMYDGGQDAYIVGGEEIAHSCGWMFKFRCRGKGPKEMQFGINHLANGVRLVYGKKNLSYRPDDAKVTIMSIDHIETPELDLFNNANGYEMGTFTDPYKPHGYTLLTYIDPIVANRLYEHPAEIIRDLLLFQAETSAGFDYDKFDKLLFENPNLKFAFSLTEPQSVKEILEKICSQSRFFYRHNMNTNQITIDQIKEQYTPEDVISTIDVDDLYRCSFDLTKKEDLCFAGVEVKYGYNYATEKYDKTTGTLSVGDKLQLYKEYYGVESVDAYKVVVEADYIHDEPTAIYLRDYLFGKNKNQNLLCKLELPLSSGFKYEVGDIVNFNKNPENTKPYGNDITSGYMKIDQNVYPFFIITKVSLTANSVKLELEQLHNTTPVYQAGLLGDVNLDGVVNGDDVTLLIEMALATDQSIYSPEQLANGDLVYDAENHQLLAGDGTVDLADAQQLNAWWRAEQEQ